jgi:hypothetical protein
MEKNDYKKQLKEFYSPSAKEISIVDVPEMNFLMIDGMGDPTKSKEFADAIQALYPVAYGIKFDYKKNKGIDFGVMPLEGLWWADDMTDFSSKKGNRDNWKWTLMIMQPEIVDKKTVEDQIKIVKEKKNPPMIDKIRFETYKEGKSAQVMYTGPFSEEGPTILKMHDKIKDLNGNLSGKHHEIYLSDFRKVAPEKMKTVLRQPFYF